MESRGDHGQAEELAYKRKPINILSQWNTSYVSTPEPKSEPVVLVLVRKEIVVALCTFEPSKIMDFPCPFQKGTHKS